MVKKKSTSMRPKRRRPRHIPTRRNEMELIDQRRAAKTDRQRAIRSLALAKFYKDRHRRRDAITQYRNALRDGLPTRMQIKIRFEFINMLLRDANAYSANKQFQELLKEVADRVRLLARAETFQPRIDRLYKRVPF